MALWKIGKEPAFFTQLVGRAGEGGDQNNHPTYFSEFVAKGASCTVIVCGFIVKTRLLSEFSTRDSKWHSALK